MRSDYTGHEVPLVPGALRVYRDWHVSPFGELLALTWSIIKWKAGINEARCLKGIGGIGVAHQSPHIYCVCGFYGKYNPAGCGGVAELSGRTILGTRGVRAQFGRVLAISYLIEPDSVVGERMRANYPDVKWFTNREEMLEEFPPQDISELIGEPVSDEFVVRNMVGEIIWRGDTLWTGNYSSEPLP